MVPNTAFFLSSTISHNSAFWHGTPRTWDYWKSGSEQADLGLSSFQHRRSIEPWELRQTYFASSSFALLHMLAEVTAATSWTRLLSTTMSSTYDTPDSSSCRENFRRKSCCAPSVCNKAGVCQHQRKNERRCLSMRVWHRGMNIENCRKHAGQFTARRQCFSSTPAQQHQSIQELTCSSDATMCTKWISVPRSSQVTEKSQYSVSNPGIEHFRLEV